MATPSVPRPERVLFVHAHPDDETLVTGGTIATLLEIGADVTVLTATRGEQGEMLTPELAPLAGDPARVAAHRETEIREALTALGGPRHLWLGGPGARPTDLPERRYTDSGMEWGPDGRAQAAPTTTADALTAADLGEIVDDIRAAIRSTGADAVVSYADDGGYGHPDHVRVHHAARYAARAEDLPFHAIVDPETGGPDVVVAVLPVRQKVRTALQRYRSQLAVDPAEPEHPDRLSYVLPHGARTVLPGREAFRSDEPPRREAAETFAEMSVGTRVAVVLGALVVGAVIGGMGTITHQALLGTFPIGWPLAIVTAAALLVGLRLVYRSRAAVAAAALGVVGATQALVAVAGSGTALVLANGAGYTWEFGPAFVALVVLVWPDLSGVRRTAPGTVLETEDRRRATAVDARRRPGGGDGPDVSDDPNRPE